MGFGGANKKQAASAKSELDVMQSQAAALQAQQSSLAASAAEEDRRRAAQAQIEEENAKKASQAKSAPSLSPLVATTSRGLLDNPRTGLSVLGN